MKWCIKYMVDPGDGIVSTEIVEHESDELVQVAADWLNREDSHGWLIGVEAVPE